MLTQKLLNEAINFSKTVSDTVVIYYYGYGEYKYSTMQEYRENHKNDTPKEQFLGSDDIEYYIEDGEILL